MPAPQSDNAVPLRPLDRFPLYWYQTGPSYIFHKFVRFVTPHSSPRDRRAAYDDQQPTYILIKREIANYNLWHNMLEIMSVMLSIEVLAKTISPTTGVHFWGGNQKLHNHVILLDDLDYGPYHDLWQAITPNPVRQLQHLTQDANPVTGNVLIPLPGGSNPFWQGDWVDIDCGESRLLHNFSRRVLSHFNIRDPAPFTKKRGITITVINRTTKRRLTNQEELFQDLENHWASSSSSEVRVHHQVIDFAALSFEEQVALAHSTDVLVGVHGAGLTHGMFLPPHSAIVEFMPFNLDHRGFRNMAKMLGHVHFGCKTVDAANVTRASGDWQEDDVYVEKHEFFRQIDLAVGAVVGHRLKQPQR